MAPLGSSGERAIILAAVRGVRRLSTAFSYPISLARVSERPVIQWSLSAFEEAGVGRVVYIGGYHIEKMIEAYPALKYYVNTTWQEDGEIRSLLKAEEDLSGPSFLVRGDVVFRPAALRKVRSVGGDVVVGFAAGAPSSDGWPGAFAGLLRASERGMESIRARAREIGEEDRRAGLVDLVDRLRGAGIAVGWADVSGDAVGLSDAEGLARFVLGTKAQTLERLRGVVRESVILHQVTFTVREWRARPAEVLRDVARAFPGERVVVRSSAVCEDGFEASMAGSFRSVLDVPADDTARLRAAVEEVAASFRNAGAEHPENQVFVQPMVDDAVAGGVLLTRTLQNLAPYYVVNYDRTDGRADAVTSGSGGDLSTAVLYRYADSHPPPPFARLLRAAEEIEDLVGVDALDIEFALAGDGRVYVFQVRPIVRRSRTAALPDDDNRAEVTHARSFVKALLDPSPVLLGETTVLGTMPDWNPAEMIGNNPRPLAASLYRRLITDSAWAEARRRIGYRPVDSIPLMVLLAGHPYIDVRASFNSFLPPGLPPEVAAQFVDAAIARLAAHPHLHDKVEFEVALTCLAFDHEARLAPYREAGIGEAEIAAFTRAMAGLTARMVGGTAEPIGACRASLAELERRRAALADDLPASPAEFPRRIRFLAEEIRRLGVVPFAVLARYAFVAMAFLKSLRASGVLSDEEYDRFLASIPTVATAMGRDYHRLAEGAISREEYLDRYGHLRPGTYDITSPTYRERPDLYLGDLGEGAPPPADSRDGRAAREIFERQRDRIDSLARSHGLRVDAGGLHRWIVEAIPAREEAKFEFTRSVSTLLDLVGEMGRRWGISRDEISFIPIGAITQFATDHTSGETTRLELLRTAEYNRKRHTLTQTILLPDLIRSERDLDHFVVGEAKPNFITRRVVTAPLVAIDPRGFDAALEGRIVLIESADPGYDGIFQRKIAGLITCYGGAASHMAIRAAEFSLPSAIGCGPALFRRLREARTVTLDCAAERIRIVG